MRAPLTVVLCLLAPCSAAELQIRYIGHACFCLTSPGGTRLVLDPYNSHVWLGYRFPETIEADAVLVSHPHFDHDAHYYIRGFPAVFRNAGRFTFGDVRMEGVRGKHADPYGREFGQINTLWLVETAGLRLAHLGDNGPLTPGEVQTLGRVDVLFAPVDDTEHILKYSELDTILAALRPRVVVPMHYRLPAGPDDLGGIDAWLAKQPRVRDAGHQMALSAAALPTQSTVFRFQPSPDVRPWTPRFREALQTVRQFNRLLDQTQGKPTSEQLAEIGPRLVRSTEPEPGFIAGWHARATLARLEGRTDDAIRLLQSGLAVARPDDIERTTLAQALLADLLAERGRASEARALWLELLRTSHRTDLLERARRGLHE
jgi:L-ascorbate metabolism protein UlaG (beta-lactamase superfamily)